jgi:hypothetical protein
MLLVSCPKQMGRLRRTVFVRLAGNVVREFSEDYASPSATAPSLASGVRSRNVTIMD